MINKYFIILISILLGLTFSIGAAFFEIMVGSLYILDNSYNSELFQSVYNATEVTTAETASSYGLYFGIVTLVTVSFIFTIVCESMIKSSAEIAFISYTTTWIITRTIISVLGPSPISQVYSNTIVYIIFVFIVCFVLFIPKYLRSTIL